MFRPAQKLPSIAVNGEIPPTPPPRNPSHPSGPPSLLGMRLTEVYYKQIKIFTGKKFPMRLILFYNCFTHW